MSYIIMMIYGSEAWNITPTVSRALNDANANMMSINTGKIHQQEVSSKWRTFGLVNWVSARRVQCLGHTEDRDGTGTKANCLCNVHGADWRWYSYGCPDGWVVVRATKVCSRQGLLAHEVSQDETVTRASRHRFTRWNVVLAPIHN